MNNVQFEEENFNYNYNTMRQQHSRFSLTKFLITRNIAKNEKQANMILLILAIILLLVSVFLLISRSRSPLDTVIYDIPDEVIISFPNEIQEAIYNKK